MKKLSAVIITYNEARNIKRCILSLQGVADEVVVVDSFSTDATPSICKGLGVQFHQREWKGYSKQKNFGNGLASHPWILSIDADEALSENLQRAILSAKQDNGHFIYTFPRITNYCGKWIRHSGWYPDIKLRMFNRDEDNWQGEVHEKPTADMKKAKHLKGDLLHYSYDSLSDHVQRTDRYSTLGAKELYQRGRNASFTKLLINPWFKFVRMFLLQRGFLDGTAGFHIALITAFGTYLKYAKLRALHSRVSK